jgi:hypothetical protein
MPPLPFRPRARDGQSGAEELGARLDQRGLHAASAVSEPAERPHARLGGDLNDQTMPVGMELACTRSTMAKRHHGAPCGDPSGIVRRPHKPRSSTTSTRSRDLPTSSSASPNTRSPGSLNCCPELAPDQLGSGGTIFCSESTSIRHGGWLQYPEAPHVRYMQLSHS